MITALFVTKDSIYKKLGIDSYDLERNALTFTGTNVIIAHPPCRTWGQLAHFSKGTKDEHDLAFFAIALIRINGGILEHPKASKLFKTILPLPGTVDNYGGFTINIDQSWFGHKAKKNTFLYINGCTIRELPKLPLNFNAIEYTIGSNTRTKEKKKEVTKKERLQTPRDLALWLINVCEIIIQNKTKK